jgi:rod shape-determining protein MreC
MRAFLERHRHGSLLVAVLLAQLFFLAYQIKADNDVRLIRRWAIAVVSPVEVGVRAVVDAGFSVLERYILLYNARQESRRLQAELDEAQLRLQELEVRAGHTDELESMLGLRQVRSDAPLVAARVIAASPATATRTLLIDRGTEDGIEVNMAVLTPRGVVGKVVAAFPATAQVLLISDQKSGVGVRVVGTDLAGVVTGTGGATCRLQYIPNEKALSPGAELITSGQDQLFPAGLPVGRVDSVRPGELFLTIDVEPSTPLMSLDHVLVLAGPPETLGTAAQATGALEKLAQ